MSTLKSKYKVEKLELQDLIEAHMKHLIELTYYKIKDANQYAVEIVKIEYLGKNTKQESKKTNLLTDNETKANKVLDILARNRVTPIGLEDCLAEIIKMKLV